VLHLKARFRAVISKTIGAKKMIKLQNFIGGEFLEPNTKKYHDVYNPSTGQMYAQSPDSDGLDVVQAVQSAHKAFVKWSTTTPQERAEYLNKIADLIEKKAPELAKAEAQNVGKPYKLALESDLARTVFNFRYFAAKIISETDMSAVSYQKNPDNPDKPQQFLNYVVRQPVGVAALIAPWNLPLYTLTWKLAPCLAMGNTAICKPSESSPMTTFMLAEILKEAGLPAGVVNIVFGSGKNVGTPIAQHPGIRLLSFTGSTETGGQLQKLTAGQFKRMSLEMGGKNANIIFKDANLKDALAGSLKASFLNSGQVCLSGSRLLVQEDIYKEFVPEFVRMTQELKVGDPMLPETFMGPLASKEQLAKVEASIEQAKSERGKILCGGERLNLTGDLAGGYFYKPTVIEDLTMCSDLWQKEVFGPVVTVMSFKYQHDAVKWANTSSYGLSASIWTEKTAQALSVASQIQAGTVWVNSWSMRDPRVPFGGIKASGMGREGGEYSMQFYSDIKTVCIKGT
jgi:aminomuconate-semialdehyde/2-hydroxymuconate-6-semialdehyde dehydrogenase